MGGRRALTVLCAAKLHKNQLERHLELLERLECVERIIVVRHAPIPERLSKVENVAFGVGSLPQSALQMALSVDSILQERRVDWVLGFNPVPWGSIAQTAAQRRGVPTCLSLIGKDFLQVQSWWGGPFLSALRRSDALTVTGAKMQHRLAALGVDSHRIRILPHSVDLDRFRPTEAPGQFDVLSVGQLIERKRMDILIEAARLLKERGRPIKVGILGRGPEKPRLLAQIESSGLQEDVKLLQYRDDVETLLTGARIFSLASEWEGVPFALMEAMATGLVPVITDVGTMSDWVEDGVTGRIVPLGDARAVADAWQDLLDHKGRRLQQMRARVLERRQRLSLTAGMEVWREILEAPC